MSFVDRTSQQISAYKNEDCPNDVSLLPALDDIDRVAYELIGMVEELTCLYEYLASNPGASGQKYS